MDDDAAVEGLTRLGLTTYEARVFIGLHKLGSGTAADVTEVVDVPRSQVYGAAEGLEERGLVETQYSTPTVYRPVSLERARTRLLDELARIGAETFEYLERIEGTATKAERSEGVWVVRGADAIDSRVADLLPDADRRIVYAVPGAGQFADEVLDGLVAAAGEEVAVAVVSEDPAVEVAVADRPGIVAETIPEEDQPEVDNTGRILLVDDDTVLLSVFSSATAESGTQEVAFWSSNTGFAAVFAEVFENWFGLSEE